MTLRRTTGGLQSLHLFYDAEKVVFCEGGKSITYRDVMSGQGDSETCDTHFWATVIGTFVELNEVHFKSVGSKSTLEGIASDIISNNITSIIVCLDKDFDDFKKNMLEHSNVLYTHGYSWENDILCMEFLEDFFFTYKNKNPGNQIIYDVISKSVFNFIVSSKRYCEFDIHFALKHSEFYFDRGRPTRHLEIGNQTVPKLNVSACQLRLSELGYKRGPVTQIKLDQSEVQRHLYGKLFARFTFHLMKHYLGRPPKKVPMHFESMMRAGIKFFGGALASGSLAKQERYYRSLAQGAFA
ncbi:hypothetical protein [Pelagibius sp.]|uniref:hypothetical protein n=1 Tax=Pelagibius sp. TaxID=1931238 RepID=UPI003B506209